MESYIYEALGTNGKKLRGVIESNSEFEAVRKLQEKELYPISVKLQTMANKDIRLKIRKKIKIKDIAVMCRQFHAMLDSGISILECVDVLRKQTENKTLAQSLGNVYQKLQKGQTLSIAMKLEKSTYPEILINMIEAGETSGQMDIVMQRMAFHFEKENALTRKIKTAMTYPAIIVAVSFMVVCFLMVFVLPTFVDMFEGSGAQLPLLTRMLLKSGDIMSSYWYIVFASLMLAMLGAGKYITSLKGRYRLDMLKIAVPIVREMNIKIMASRFSRTLSTLLASGIPIIQAMGIVKKIMGNSVVSKGMDAVMNDIKRGEGLSRPLSEVKIFPPMLISMVRVGEESGTLSEMLSKSADYYDMEVEDSIARMTALLEPMLIVVMAVIIGTIVMAIVMPMFDMYQYLGS
ncbi:general secretion pathway protein F [Peptoclostridium acidaminophilum DSM 3953]|uniref:General secretion pathway protein F n=1 Tax=Peptoclostridium acidaminophilum DSM 3953 TaxID=1286171 RepID=W8T5A1_PEPAC|nr:type II secretion system F family protein [Peptoclostridium acidaminophilum]AHM56934.1 general secretion pathway protein F [Peptoclostridium acidaminophilum DSM 3953]